MRFKYPSKKPEYLRVLITSCLAWRASSVRLRAGGKGGGSWGPLTGTGRARITPEWGRCNPHPRIHTPFIYLLVHQWLRLLCALDTQTQTWSGAGPAEEGEGSPASSSLPAERAGDRGPSFSTFPSS